MVPMFSFNNSNLNPTSTSTANPDTNAAALSLLRVLFQRYHYAEDRYQKWTEGLNACEVPDVLAAAVDNDIFSSHFVRAANENAVQLVVAFLNKGICVNIKNGDNDCALISASVRGHEEIVRLLLDHNADVNIVNRYGASALMVAVINRRSSIVRLLLERNAKPNIGNGRGTALTCACEDNDEEMVELLLLHGADANAQQLEEGLSALMIACQHGHAGIVQLLLESSGGCDVEAVDMYGKTAFDHCSDSDDDVLELLEGHRNSYLLK